MTDEEIAKIERMFAEGVKRAVADLHAHGLPAVIWDCEKQAMVYIWADGSRTLAHERDGAGGEI